MNFKDPDRKPKVSKLSRSALKLPTKLQLGINKAQVGKQLHLINDLPTPMTLAVPNTSTRLSCINISRFQLTSPPPSSTHPHTTSSSNTHSVPSNTSHQPTMSGLLNKVKDAASSSSGGSGGGGGVEKYVNDATHKGEDDRSRSCWRWLTRAAVVTDQATDRAGLGDKYDDKINKFTDSETKKQVSLSVGLEPWGMATVLIRGSLVEVSRSDVDSRVVVRLDDVTITVAIAGSLYCICSICNRVSPARVSPTSSWCTHIPIALSSKLSILPVQ